jgi:hypothetical protein
MTKQPKDFRGQAFLELLRPPKLARTRFALFAAYSADPIVLGGALLNLHARGRDNAGGNRSDFASAVEALRDRVRFVVQRGRVHRGSNLPKIAAVLDQFVVEVPYRERHKSWHPKIALLCYEDHKAQCFWRLWVGSRNLTMSRDLDLGLVLDGEARRRKGSRMIAGIDKLGGDLAQEASLPGVDATELARTLRDVRWLAPEGIEVSSVDLWTSGGEPTFPLKDDTQQKLVVFSPFLCDAFASHLAARTARSGDRTLVTTLPALRRLAPKTRGDLAGFKILSLAAPMPEGDERAPHVPSALQDQTSEEDEGGDAGAAHSGLHAKLYAAIDGDVADIVAGSANATDRAWSGRNAEVMARFRGGKPEVDGIMAIVGSATPISVQTLEALVESESEAAERKLEQLRWHLSELPLAIRREGKRFALTCDVAPALPQQARLEVGLATMCLFKWSRGATRVDFGDVPLSLQTDLVQFRLTMGDLPTQSWLQRIAVQPVIDGDRDSAAISRFLSVAGLQAWLREMLDGDGGGGSEDDWDMDPDGAPPRRSSWKHDGFALEDILTAWAKDPKQNSQTLKRVDAMLERYVAAVLKHSEHMSAEDRQDLLALQATWGVARDVLLARN